MFGEAGRLYVYLIYGMHHCANVVTGSLGDGQAVLIRAVEPLTGLDRMRDARPAARSDRDLTNGPGKLCAALGIDRSHNGTDLLAESSEVRLSVGESSDDAEPSETAVGTAPRVGIAVAERRPWRWYVVDSEWVSRPKPA